MVTECRVCEAGRAIFGLGIDRLKKDLETEILVLFNHFGQARFVSCKAFFPAFFLEFFFSGHLFRSKAKGTSVVNGQ